MISEEQQEQAGLHALGLLDADEAVAFEHEMAADGELRTLAAELSETAASLARTTSSDAMPPPTLKGCVLARVQAETLGHPAVGKVIAGPSAWMRWVPWSVAAALAVCCGSLAVFSWKLVTDGVGQGYRLIDSERRAQTAEAELVAIRQETSGLGSLRQIAFCTLEPVPAAQQTGPRAEVLWNAAQRQGRLHIAKLPPAGEGKDYQFWTVEAGRKDPVSAGVVKVGPDNSVEIEFRPEGDDGKAEVVAFALSVERVGGVPKNEGPIIYLGKL